MRWDIFCRVIDNHGDAGVCWRLARALATDGDSVRLWIDDASALDWMAPHGHPGVTVVHWSDTVPDALLRAPAPDVLIEAFGCDPAPELIAHFAASPADPGLRRRWINLEYLSAEAYVERLHGLPSPVFRGPGAGLTKHFFYPGFTPATGGLLREATLAEAQAQFDRAAWLQGQGIAWHGEALASLYCYEPAALAGLLAPPPATEAAQLLVTPGRAAAQVQRLIGDAGRVGALEVTRLPALAQPEFDRLLWACDLNFVRGEDSLVRALWAGAPLVWQIYSQDDDAHHAKLEAFLDWLDAPASLRSFHRAWNGITDAPVTLPAPAVRAEWRENARAARARLREQDDLVTRLRRFVVQKS